MRAFSYIFFYSIFLIRKTDFFVIIIYIYFGGVLVIIVLVALIFLVLCSVFFILLYQAVVKENKVVQEKEVDRVVGIIDSQHTLLSSFDINKNWVLHYTPMNLFLDVSVYLKSGILVVDLKDAGASVVLAEEFDNSLSETDKNWFPVCVAEPGISPIKSNIPNLDLAKKYSTCQVPLFAEKIDGTSYYHSVFTPELDNQTFKPVRYVLIHSDEDLLMQTVTVFGKPLSELFFPKQSESEE